MGADLYIKNLPREAQYAGFEVSNDAVKAGYFRDCYNPSGLFWVLRDNLEEKDLSWWRLSDKKDWFTQDKDRGRVMHIDGVKAFRRFVLSVRTKFNKLEKYVKSSVPMKKKEVKYIYMGEIL